VLLLLNQITFVSNHAYISQDLKTISKQYGILNSTVSQLGFQNERFKSKQSVSKKTLFKWFTVISERSLSFGKFFQLSGIGATTIAEELIEHDRKKNNIVVYNFPTTKKNFFVKMCKVTIELDVNTLNFIGLQKVIQSKILFFI